MPPEAEPADSSSNPRRNNYPPTKNRVRTNIYINMKVACRTAVCTCVTSAAYIKNLLILDTCRNCYINSLVLALFARTAALFARIVNNLTSAVTGITGTLSLDNTERCSLVDCNLTRTAA